MGSRLLEETAWGSSGCNEYQVGSVDRRLLRLLLFRYDIG
jgi:hypothetical protein